MMETVSKKIKETRKKINTTQGLLKLVDKTLKSCDKGFASGHKIFTDARNEKSKIEFVKKVITIAEDEDVKNMISDLKELKNVSYKEILESTDNWNIITKLKAYKTLKKISTWTDDKIEIVKSMNEKFEKEISEFDGNLEVEYHKKHKRGSLNKYLTFLSENQKWEATINYLKKKKEWEEKLEQERKRDDQSEEHEPKEETLTVNSTHQESSSILEEEK